MEIPKVTALYPLVAAITAKPEWERKVHDAAITANWSREAVAQGADPKVVADALAVLHRLASPAVAGAPSLSPEDAVEDVVVDDVAVVGELADRLRVAFDQLRDVPGSAADWHPGSNEKVLDLVHPSLYCGIDKHTRLRDGSVLHTRAGKGNTYQWLPAEVDVAEDGRCEFRSPINNLHPDWHRGTYALLAEALGRFVPLFERCRNPSAQPTEPAVRGQLERKLSQACNADEQIGERLHARRRHLMKQDAAVKALVDRLRKERKQANQAARAADEGDDEEDGSPDGTNEQQKADAVEDEETEEEAEADAEEGSGSDADEDGNAEEKEEKEEEKEEEKPEEEDKEAQAAEVAQVAEAEDPEFKVEDDDKYGIDADDYDDDSDFMHSESERELEVEVLAKEDRILADLLERRRQIRLTAKERWREFKAPGGPMRLRGRRIQVIVKAADISVPRDDRYPGGVWHIEGTDTERIVASGISYYAGRAVGHSFLEFRRQLPEPPYAQSQDRYVKEVYGMENEQPLNEHVGTVHTKTGRCIAFPNDLQHRVQPVYYQNPAHGEGPERGVRSILCFFLVDPDHRIPSTADLHEPQQWWWLAAPLRQLLRRVLASDDVIRLVLRFARWQLSLGEAKEHRVKLMDQRRAVTKDETENFEELFSLCEH